MVHVSNSATMKECQTGIHKELRFPLSGGQSDHAPSVMLLGAVVPAQPCSLEFQAGYMVG